MDKDEMVKQEVVEMGDNDYVCRSERAKQEELAEVVWQKCILPCRKATTE